MGYRSPGIAEMTDQRAFRQAVILQQSGGTFRGARTSLSLSGTRQLNATAQSISDIMQGTMAVRGAQDMNMIINRALSSDLDFLHASDYATISSFSSAKYQDVGTLNDVAGNDASNTNSGASTFNSDGPIEGKFVAQIANQVGFTETGVVPLWKMVAISGRESDWTPHLSNPSTSDRGLWQINMSAHGNTLVGEGILTGGPYGDPHAGYTEWTPQLYDPVINGRAVYQIVYGRGGDPNNNMEIAWGAGPLPGGGFGWVGPGGDPLSHTDPAAAKKAVADAKSEGLLGKPFMPAASAGGDLGGGPSTVLTNTKAELIKAGNKLADHPNNWLVNQSQFNTFLRHGLTNSCDGSNGTPPPPANQYSTVLIDGITYMQPSTMSYLYYICDNGYILDSCQGSLFVKYIKNSNPPKLSNHSHGGAVDIGRIGLASEGRTFGFDGGSNVRRVGDKLFNFLSTLPPTSWADEHGTDWTQHYGTQGFHTYPDAGHLHIGFNQSHVGKLSKALLS